VNQKPVLFTQFITAQEVVKGLASKISLVFAPGLFDVLKAATPPTSSTSKDCQQIFPSAGRSIF
jgi:hypothetical protein